ncbi:PREDICTED: cysteine-rich PDZ-binding protein [Chaetura pelagica]|uniref:cysteine-rich PDZ-binding protein n=1 Tax=Chaetura pelagica TaxID=8897 RepID=UPI0005235744|nr:PREDICTED: cysteine-rich PDZ-binding protein [Chaetura pelagica]
MRGAQSGQPGPHPHTGSACCQCSRSVALFSSFLVFSYVGEKKLGTVITPDTWKDGARNTTESGGRKLNENKALTSKKARFDPYGKNKFAICRICKSSVHQPGSHYCQGCAYKKGICSMCGKKVLDTKNYKQTSV